MKSRTFEIKIKENRRKKYRKINKSKFWGILLIVGINIKKEKRGEEMENRTTR